MALEKIIAEGNRPAYTPFETYDARLEASASNNIVCADGFTLSVIAGAGTYCSPRPDLIEDMEGFTGPFTAVEVGFPSDRPEPWSEWEEWCESPENPTSTVYGQVPVAAVRALVALHGGEQA
jgi:hypothetical protein